MMILPFLFFTVSTLINVGECGVVYETKTEQLGQWRASILLELSKQVIELQSKTSLTWLEESVKVSSNKNSIKKTESEAESTVETELTNLDNAVGEAIIKANKSGKNISMCIVTEQTNRWINVDTNDLSQCKDSLSFSVVGLKLAELIAIPAGTSTIVPMCTLLHPINNDNFKKCLQDELDKLQTKLTTISNNIDGELNTITDKAKTCIQDNLQTLKQEIKNISSDFSKCVKKVGN